MLLGETNINGVKSFLFAIDGKLTGYQIKGWQKFPLDDSVFNELKKLQLSNNNRVIEDEYYKVILDLDTGYKHYFKDNKEDLMMFYEMNGVDETLYQGKGKSNLRRKIGTIVFLSFEAFVLCINLYYMMSKKNAEDANYQIIYITKDTSLFTDKNEILPLSVDEISNYIKSSTRLNEKEKAYLNNELLFEDLLPYINKKPELVFILRYTLSDIDIQPEEEGVDCKGIAGYNDGSKVLHVIGYEEECFTNYSWIVGHEFCHDFQMASEDFNYLSEATNELLASEYFNRPIFSYEKQVKILKCLMEIVGVEPVLESHLCDNSCNLYDALTPYLTDEEIALFHIDKRIVDYTDEENEIRFNQLKKVLEHLYYGMYGESMWNNSMITSIFYDLDYERYYFNSEKIQNIEMYASCYGNVEYSLEDAIIEGYVYPYTLKTENVSLEEWLQYNGNKNISFHSSLVDKVIDLKYLRIFNDDESYYDIPLEEAVSKGYISDINCTIIYKDSTSDLNNPEIKYDLEEDCYFDGDKVICPDYKKEYFSPVQKSVNVLN